MVHSLLLIVIACVATIVSASPIAQGSKTQPEARAVPGGSAGVMCYFSCPDKTGTTFMSKSSGSDYTGVGGVRCGYNNGDRCYYTFDGNLSGRDTAEGFNSQGCEPVAPSAGCGTSNPNPVRAFRRAYVPRARTEAEQRIAARQYKPAKVRKAKVGAVRRGHTA